MTSISIRENIWFGFDSKLLHKYQREIKQDPNRFYLTKREYNKKYNRFKRFSIQLFLASFIIYKQASYHNELGQIKRFQLHKIMVGKFIIYFSLANVVLFPLLSSFLVDRFAINCHHLAELVKQKYDDEMKPCTNWKYKLDAPLVFCDPESKFGRNYYSRFFTAPYYQTAGYLQRLRQKNSNIDNEIPPTYEFTGKGTVNLQKKLELLNQQTTLIKNHGFAL